MPATEIKAGEQIRNRKKRNINVGLSSRTMHSLFSSLPFRSSNSFSAWEETLTSLATSPVGINSHTYGSWRWLPREAGGNGGAVWAQHLEEWFVPRAEPPFLDQSSGGSLTTFPDLLPNHWNSSDSGSWPNRNFSPPLKGRSWKEEERERRNHVPTGATAWNIFIVYHTGWGVERIQKLSPGNTLKSMTYHFFVLLICKSLNTVMRRDVSGTHAKQTFY